MAVYKLEEVLILLENQKHLVFLDAIYVADAKVNLIGYSLHVLPARDPLNACK